MVSTRSIPLIGIALFAFAAQMACSKAGKTGSKGRLDGPAASATSILPKDTSFVVGLNFDKLKTTRLWEKVGARILANGKGDMDEVKAECGIDFLSDFQSLTLAGDASFDGKKMVLIMKGKWDEDKATSCVVKMAKKKENKTLTIKKEGGITELKPEGTDKSIHLAWIGKDTVVITPGSPDDKTYLAELVARKSSINDNKELMAILSKSSSSATIWGAGTVPSVGPAAQALGALSQEQKPQALYATVEYGKTLDAKVGLRYAALANAKSVRDQLDGQLKEAQGNPMLAGYLKTASVAVQDNDVVLAVAMPEQTLSSLTDMVESQLGMFLMMMGGGMGGM
jgi:hypothetical protein